MSRKQSMIELLEQNIRENAGNLTGAREVKLHKRIGQGGTVSTRLFKNVETKMSLSALALSGLFRSVEGKIKNIISPVTGASRKLFSSRYVRASNGRSGAVKRKPAIQATAFLKVLVFL